jgi:hypothetical protein
MIGSESANEKQSTVHSEIVLLIKSIFEYLIYCGLTSFNVQAKCFDSIKREYSKYVNITTLNEPNRVVRLCNGVIEYNLLNPLINNVVAENCFELFNQLRMGEGIGLGYRPDVALCCGNKLVTAIEVVYTHRVTEEKEIWYNSHRNDMIIIDVSKLDDADVCALWARWEDNDLSILDDLEIIVSVSDVSSCHVDHRMITLSSTLRNTLKIAKNRSLVKATDFVDREFSYHYFNTISMQHILLGYFSDLDINTLCFSYYKGLITADEWEWYYERAILTGYWHSWSAICDESKKRMIEHRIHSYLNDTQYYGKKAKLLTPTEIKNVILEMRRKKYAEFMAMLPEW